MRCFLGIDAGGSKCDAVLAAWDGQVLGWGRNDPVVLSTAGVEFVRGVGRSAGAASSAISKAMGSVVCSGLDVAGMDTALHGLLHVDGMPKAISHHPASEFNAALALAGLTCGMAALAGTGAFVAGRTVDGRILHLDGLGPMAGDRGGGFQVGLAALRAAARSAWHVRHKTSLAGALPQLQKHESGDPYNPVGYMLEDVDRSVIASFARIVNHEAGNGDRVAVELLQLASAELASTAFDVGDRLKIVNEEYTLVGVGGLLLNSRLYWEHFCDKVRDFAPRWQLVRGELPAVLGYVLLAARDVTGIEYSSFRARLLASARERVQSEKEKI